MENICKYGCTNGRVFDTNTKHWVLCPECAGKRREEVKGEGNKALEILNVVPDGLTGVYVPEAVIPDNERHYLDEDSWSTFSRVSLDLYNSLLRGESPSVSMCFGVGVKGAVDRFAYPMLSSAYSSGLSVAPFTSALSLAQKIVRQDNISDLTESDVLIILVNEGCSKFELQCCKGVMQERATKRRGTIFISTWSIEACSRLLGYFDDDSLYLAKPVFVKYRYSEKSSKYINNLTGERNAIPDLVFDDF